MRREVQRDVAIFPGSWTIVNGATPKNGSDHKHCNKVPCTLPDQYIHQYIQRGEHNIKDELIFLSSPGFIFHDSQGFEGGVFQLYLVKKFLVN